MRPPEFQASVRKDHSHGNDIDIVSALIEALQLLESSADASPLEKLAEDPLAQSLRDLWANASSRDLVGAIKAFSAHEATHLNALKIASLCAPSVVAKASHLIIRDFEEHSAEYMRRAFEVMEPLCSKLDNMVMAKVIETKQETESLFIAHAGRQGPVAGAVNVVGTGAVVRGGVKAIAVGGYACNIISPGAQIGGSVTSIHVTPGFNFGV